MNYVILNGVKSTSINGLLIQSLPSISKPLVRTQIDQIDGRDGDIVTTLGYSAYDKEMTIGLYGNYDINEVIQYFNSQGTVTFSNEPDKYYNYQIISQIDFEKLIRFKTAKVTFHVQPFKYSNVDKPYILNNQFVNVQSYSETQNGVTVTATNGVISIVGTATEATEFYVPIEPVTVNAGSYTLSAECSGTNAYQVQFRLVKNASLNSLTFGGAKTYLQDDTTVNINATLDTEEDYNYLWFNVKANVAVNTTVNVELTSTSLNSLVVNNHGNIYSKPSVTIYGSGTINLSVNGVDAFVINLGSAEYLTIDSDKMNAFQGNILMNRSVVGDYENLYLNVGNNTISWTGNVTALQVTNFTRWL